MASTSDITIRHERRRVQTNCTKRGREYGSLHMFYADSDGDPAALVEDNRGAMYTVHATDVIFIDRPKAAKDA